MARSNRNLTSKLVLSLSAVLVALVVGRGSAWCQAQIGASLRGTPSFFRLKVDLTYEGQPVGIDIVVGCSVRVGHPLAGGTSIDTLRMADFVFARRIPDGHAISIRTKPFDGRNRDPCRGATTANGGIRSDFLPVVIWYDEADDLSHGFAYVVRDSYRSPSARLVFDRAVISTATEAEFDRFKSSATPNLIPYYIADIISHLETPYIRKPEDLTPDVVAQPTRAWPRTSWTSCAGMRRWRVPPHLAADVRERWPIDRPKIWAVDGRSAKDIFEWVHGGSSSETTGGEDYVVVPSFRDTGLSQLRATTFQDGTYYDDTSMADVDNRPGLVFCDRDTPPPLYEAVTGRKALPAARTHWVCRMDGIVVATGWVCSGRQYVVFDRDEYVYGYFEQLVD